MDRTLIVCASHYGLELQTQACVTALQKHGARLLSITGVADVALARNRVFTEALQSIARENLPTDVLLAVDDDMVFDLNAATKLVSLARESGEAWSAAYATYDAKGSHLASTPLEWDGKRSDGLRMVGLGLCAVPLGKFTELAQKLGAVVGPNGQGIIPFCQCRVVVPEHDNVPRWCSEDYWFCRSIGGVRLAPHVAAGHLKTVPLWPDPETLHRLAEGAEPKDNTPPSEPPAPAPSTPPPSGEKTAPETPAALKKGRNRKKRKGNTNGATQTPA